MEDIKNYEAMIMSIIKKLGIIYDRDDYMQIGRIAVYTAQGKYDKTKAKCTLDQFIYTHIYQRIVDQIRKESHYHKNITVTEDTILDTHERNTHFDSYLMEEVITQLNEKEQFVCFHLIEGYKLSEIAKMLHISNSTAKNIRVMVRKKLKPYFYPLEF